jgi:hypothetical protein
MSITQKYETEIDLEQPLLSEESVSTLVLIHDSEPVISAPVAEEVIRIPHAEAVNPDAADNERDENSVGRWKDGLFNCCAHGCCHPSFILPFYLPFSKYRIDIEPVLIFPTRTCNDFLIIMFRNITVAIAQVMSRSNLLITGSRGSSAQTKITFFILCCVTVALLLYTPTSVAPSMNPYRYYPDTPKKAENLVIVGVASWASILLFYLVIVTRSYIRRRDRIPEGCCVGCEDCCVSIVFPLCTISQLMRHTADYRVYRAPWCSFTGLPDGVVSENENRSDGRN